MIGGGNANQIQSGAFESFLGGGNSSSIAADAATLGGGANNQIQSGANFSVIGGGSQNIIWPNATDSFLGGGYANYIRNGAAYSVLNGGYFNVVSNNYDSVGGGSLNKATADYATVPGGASNLAGGKFSFAAGQQAQATNQGAFVWADSQNAPFSSTNNDSFNVRAQGGVRLVTGGAGLSVDGQPVTAGSNVLTNGESGVSLGSLSVGGLTLTGNMKVPYPFSVVSQTTFLSNSSFLYSGNNNLYLGLYSGHGDNGSYNSGFGDQVLEYTTGNENTAVGNAALGLNSTGFQNTSVGSAALFANQDGVENTAVGASALYNNASGGGNAAGGAFALFGNSGGGYNTAFGFQSLYGNVGGSNNLAIGTFALFAPTSASGNVAVGPSALGNSQNPNGLVAVGYQALQNDTSGFGNNTAIGYNALNANQAGSQNTALGFQALLNNTTGVGNVAVGVSNLAANLSGGANSAVGNDALANSTGSGNTAIGDLAGNNLHSGSSNIYIGNPGQTTESGIIRIGQPGVHIAALIAGTLVGDGGGLTNVTAIPIPKGMALVPAGLFTLGDSLDGEADAIPTAALYVSAFYMDENLVTYPQWQSVYFWATNNGYVFDNAGTGTDQWGAYAALNKPVTGVNWYDCVKWCNARSEQAGLTPVYSQDVLFSTVYRGSDSDAVFMNPAANGFRLPTEAEWEKAARGGLHSQRFPWGMVINENLANYYNSPGKYSYDLGGNTQSALTGGSSYPPNLFGLYDMPGNAVTWCYDWYDGTPFPAGSPYLGGIDPLGPASSNQGWRVVRSCGYDQEANAARCASRQALAPSTSVITGFGNGELGLRCVRGH